MASWVNAENFLEPPSLRPWFKNNMAIHLCLCWPSGLDIMWKPPANHPNSLVSAPLHQISLCVTQLHPLTCILCCSPGTNNSEHNILSRKQNKTEYLKILAELDHLLNSWPTTFYSRFTVFMLLLHPNRPSDITLKVPATRINGDMFPKDFHGLAGTAKSDQPTVSSSNIINFVLYMNTSCPCVPTQISCLVIYQWSHMNTFIFLQCSQYWKCIFTIRERNQHY